MKTKVLLFIVWGGLSVHTVILGQEYLNGAKDAFAKEDYWQAMTLCNATKADYSSKNLLRDNLYAYSKRCDSLLNKTKNCDIFALNKIKQIRIESYKLTNSPKTDKKLDECKNPKLQSENNLINKTNAPIKLKFESEQITAKGSYPLTDTVQLRIIHSFLEKFAEAFRNKDITFIEMVFNDYALIIHEETKITYKTDKDGKKIKQEYTQKTKKGKEQYINDLRNAFENTNNDSINIDFHDIKIYRSKKDTNIYGINFLQIWQLPDEFNESGCGWVFLKIDFTNIQEPSIWIKTWQSYGTEEDDRYWLGSFKARRGK
jgi:hypothetical protein